VDLCENGKVHSVSTKYDVIFHKMKKYVIPDLLYEIMLVS